MRNVLNLKYVNNNPWKVRTRESTSQMEPSEKAKSSQSKRIREKICNICGDQGYTNALMYCSQCSHTIVHQSSETKGAFKGPGYCVGIPPANLDDVYSWVCEFCSKVTEPESHRALASDSNESSERCTVHAETVTFKSKSETMVIPDELKATCKIKSEPKEMPGSSLIAEDYKEQNEIPVSCSIDYPESIIYRTVFLVSPSGIINISRRKVLSEDFIPCNSANREKDNFLKDDEQSDSQVSSLCLLKYGEQLEAQVSSLCLLKDVVKPEPQVSSVCHLKYGEEPEAQVSSVMENPEEISRELILLVKPAGEIIFYCLRCVVSSADDSHFSCWKADICNMVFKRPGPYLHTLDGVTDRSEDFAKDSSVVEVVKQTCVLSKEEDMWSSDDSTVFQKNYTQGDVVLESIFDATKDMEENIQQSTEYRFADGSSCKRGTIRMKRKISPIIYDHVPPIGPECKRARCKKYTKRWKMKSIKSILACDRIRPLTPDCKRGRSKRCKLCYS